MIYDNILRNDSGYYYFFNNVLGCRGKTTIFKLTSIIKKIFI